MIPVYLDGIWTLRLALAGPTTAPLETAGIGARPVGPGVAMTTGASSSRKASAMWGATLNQKPLKEIS